jgi:hypothetical protein
MTVSLLELTAAILLSSASLLVLWAIRLCDREPEEPVSPVTRNRLRAAAPEPEEMTLRRAA